MTPNVLSYYTSDYTFVTGKNYAPCRPRTQGRCERTHMYIPDRSQPPTGQWPCSCFSEPLTLSPVMISCLENPMYVQKVTHCCFWAAAALACSCNHDGRLGWASCAQPCKGSSRSGGCE